MLMYNPTNKDNLESFQRHGDVGFTDVTAAQFNTFLYEDRWDSRERNLDSERLRVAGLAYEAAPELFGDVKPELIEGSGHAVDVLNQARKETAALQNKVRASDYEGVVEPNLEYLKTINPDILNRDEIDQYIADRAEELRGKFEDAYSRASSWDAFWGTLAGSAGGAMTDPVNIGVGIATAPLMVAAGTASVGIGFAGTLGRVMGLEFLAGTISEGAIQYGAVYDYKQEINSPWELQDSLIAVGSAGVGAALLGGAFHSIGRAWNKFIAEDIIKPSHKQQQFFNDMMIAQKLVDELKDGAKSQGELNARLTVLTDILKDLRAGRTPDLSHLDAKIDQEQMGIAEAEIEAVRIKLNQFNDRKYELEQQFDEDVYEQQLQLSQWSEQKMSPYEERVARETAGQEVDAALDQSAALEDIRFAQQKAYEINQAEESLRVNEQVNKAIHELRASRREHGDMLKIKEEMDTVDARFDEQARYLKAVQSAKEEYINLKAEEARTKIKIAEHDSEAVRGVKNIVNKYLADNGIDNPNIKIYESDFDVKVRDNVYRIKHKKSGDLEINGGVKAVDFHNALSAAMKGNKNAGSVDVYSPKDYLNSDLYLVDGGKAGFAIQPDGLLISVFKAPDSKIKAMDTLMPLAIENGATRLEAFDGFLTKQYERFGFEEVERLDWDEQYKPENWNDELGTPDLVIMDLNRDKYYEYATNASKETVQDLRGIQRSHGRVRKAAEESGRGNGSGWREGWSATPLEGAPSVRGFSGPDPRLVEVADSYARANGIELKRQAEYVDVDVERAGRLAQAYDEMEHAPNDPVVREAYENLVRQTVAQYEALVNAGYRFWFTDTNIPDNAEYLSTPWNAMRDIRENQVMGIYPTNDGFGTSDFDPAANPLLADTGLTWPIGSVDGEVHMPVLANDLFRAVHDAFGHGLEGTGFRARGEENAWQAHIRLFTGSARGAITSETRGQNSWLNYGPHGESNRTAKVEDTVFADQKTGLMPEWTWTEGLVGDQVVEAASPMIRLDKDTGELYINASAVKDADHLSRELQAELNKQFEITNARTTVSGIKPETYEPSTQADEVDMDAEVDKVLSGEQADDIPIHDDAGNEVDYKTSLEESEAEIEAYESIKVCML